MFAILSLLYLLTFQQQIDDGRLLLALGGGKGAVANFFSMSTLWGKVPERSTLILAIPPLSLKHNVAGATGSVQPF